MYICNIKNVTTPSEIWMDFCVWRADRPAQDEDRAAPQEQRRRWPSAMALQRRRAGPSRAATSSSVQTAFQMSLTVLSFLAFGGYVISLVAQNARRPQHSDASLMTPPRPLKTVVVNQNRRPTQRPVSTATPVSFGRRKRRSCDPSDGNGQDRRRKCRGA